MGSQWGMVLRGELLSHLVGLWERGNKLLSMEPPQETQASLGLRGSHMQSTTNNEKETPKLLRHSMLVFVLEMCFTRGALGFHEMLASL